MLAYVSEFHFLYSTNITCKDRRPTGESVGDYKPNIENVKIRIGSVHASWLCQGSRRESRLDGSYESSGPSSRHDHDNMLNLQMPCKYKVESQCGREPVSHSQTMHERGQPFFFAFEHLAPRSFLDIHDLPLNLSVCPERHDCLPLTNIFSLHTHPLHLLDKNLRSV